MSEEKTASASTGGIGFLGALGLLFIGLKLGHVIDWHWMWVTAPLWGPVAAFFTVVAVAGILIFLGSALYFAGKGVKSLAKRFQTP